MDTGKPTPQVDEIWGRVLVQRIAYGVVIWIHNHNHNRTNGINKLRNCKQIQMARPWGAITVQRLQGIELNWNEIKVRKSASLSLSLSLSLCLSLLLSLCVRKFPLLKQGEKTSRKSEILCQEFSTVLKLVLCHSVLCLSSLDWEIPSQIKMSMSPSLSLSVSLCCVMFEFFSKFCLRFLRFIYSTYEF